MSELGGLVDQIGRIFDMVNPLLEQLGIEFKLDTIDVDPEDCPNNDCILYIFKLSFQDPDVKEQFKYYITHRSEYQDKTEDIQAPLDKNAQIKGNGE